MRIFSSRKKSAMLQPRSFLAGLSLVSNIFSWLASLVRPTDEEKEQAGVYLGGEGRD